MTGAQLGPIPVVEHHHYLETGGEVYSAVAGMAPSGVRGGGHGGQMSGAPRGRGRGRRRGAPPAGAGAGPGLGAGARVDRVGRSPGDWKKCVSAAGEVICVAFQLGRCKRLVF